MKKLKRSPWNVFLIFIWWEKNIYETVNKTKDLSGCSEYVSEINLLIESINGTNLTNDQKSQIRELSLKNIKYFLLFD